jgi:hypothetical protein
MEEMAGAGTPAEVSYYSFSATVEKGLRELN